MTERHNIFFFLELLQSWDIDISHLCKRKVSQQILSGLWFLDYPV